MNLHHNAINLAGQRFGQLVALSPIRRHRHKVNWLCKCDCGGDAVVATADLRSHHTVSCGCRRGQRVDIVGQRFGRLVAVARVGKKSLWLCRCDCGAEPRVCGSSLRSGTTKSCGCLAIDNARALGKRNKTHGYGGSRIYSIWYAMIKRCCNPGHRCYADYGGRGITVCDRWKAFENFLADVG